MDTSQVSWTGEKEEELLQATGHWYHKRHFWDHVTAHSGMFLPFKTYRLTRWGELENQLPFYPVSAFFFYFKFVFYINIGRSFLRNTLFVKSNKYQCGENVRTPPPHPLQKKVSSCVKRRRKTHGHGQESIVTIPIQGKNILGCSVWYIGLDKG